MGSGSPPEEGENQKQRTYLPVAAGQVRLAEGDPAIPPTGHASAPPGTASCDGVSVRLSDPTQGPEKHTNIKEYFPETGFDVLPAVSGCRATVHDWFPKGLGRFVRRSGIPGEFLYVPFLYVSFCRRYQREAARQRTLLRTTKPRSAKIHLDGIGRPQKCGRPLKLVGLI